MRMSCNGCRVLRRGCSDDCPIRPSLRWIKSSQSQANATVFLAKFYGRAGLINLLNAGPLHLRPAIFKSLLYEACGRIVNPIYGATGLMFLGSWHLCQEAVEAVLNGAPITRISSDVDPSLTSTSPPLQACDVRHVYKPNKGSSISSDSDRLLHKVKKSRGRFKRQAAKPAVRAGSMSGDSHLSQGPVRGSEADSASVDTVEASVQPAAEDGAELLLELTLGFDRTARRASVERQGSDDDTCQLRVGYDAWEVVHSC